MLSLGNENFSLLKFKEKYRLKKQVNFILLNKETKCNKKLLKLNYNKEFYEKKKWF